MDDPAIASRLDGNVKLARSIGVDGTPALVIGGELLPGAMELGDLQDAVAGARKGK
jgi:protein-disulfide isomerase